MRRDRLPERQLVHVREERNEGAGDAAEDQHRIRVRHRGGRNRHQRDRREQRRVFDHPPIPNRSTSGRFANAPAMKPTLITARTQPMLAAPRCRSRTIRMGLLRRWNWRVRTLATSQWGLTSVHGTKGTPKRPLFLSYPCGCNFSIIDPDRQFGAISGVAR